jgi:rhombotail lipoprotein
MRLPLPMLLLLLLCTALGGCALDPQRGHYSSSVVDYLYPHGHAPVQPSVPVLNLPLSVGIAFVPGERGGGTGRFRGEALSETQKMELMQQVAQHFAALPYVREIQLIPTAYLAPGGGFDNLEQIRTMYGVDVIALVSYDQMQFTDPGMLSLTYLTIVGAYVIPGNLNDTQTMLDAVVLDIHSRKLLFRAPGMSHVDGRATPIDLAQDLREDAQEGFEQADHQMIMNLEQQLAVFKEKVKERPAEYTVVKTSAYRGGGGIGIGGGALDPVSFALVLLLGVGTLWQRRRA